MSAQRDVPTPNAVDITASKPHVRRVREPPAPFRDTRGFSFLLNNVCKAHGPSANDTPPSLALLSTRPPLSANKTNSPVDCSEVVLLFVQSLFAFPLISPRAVVYRLTRYLNPVPNDVRTSFNTYFYVCNVREFIRHLTPCLPSILCTHTHTRVRAVCEYIRSPFACTTHKHKYVLRGFVAPAEYKSLFARACVSLFSKYKTLGACYVYSLVYYSRHVVYA